MRCFGAPACLCVLGCDPTVIVGHELPLLPTDATTSDAHLPASLPWTAGHETADLSEWLGDGTGWQFVGKDASLGVSTDQAHTGRYAIKTTLTSTTSGQVTQAVVARDITLAEGWYGAWYFLPTPEVVHSWVVMKLSHGAPSQAARADASALLQDPGFNLFDIDLDSGSDGVFHLYLFEHATQGYIAGPSSTSVPSGQWFHIEIFFRSTPASDGRVAVQLNGVTVLDTGPRSTAPDAAVSWLVGSAARIISPLPAVLYIDDAEIRTGGPP